MPSVWRESGLACVAGTYDLPFVPLSGFRDCGDHLRGFAQAVETVVSSDLAHHQPKEWGQRDGAPTGPGLAQLPNRVDMASQTSQSDGPT